MQISRLIEKNPTRPMFAIDRLSQCIEAVFDCAQATEICADACLGEKDVAMLIRCIRLNQDCADICLSTGKILTRQQQPDVVLLRGQLEACQVATSICAEECGRHAKHYEHCRLCADACRACANACRDALQTLGTSGSHRA